jgi:hypothetical protein
VPNPTNYISGCRNGGQLINLEARIGTLFFVCPATGIEVSTDIKIDPASYRELPNSFSEILCPQCQQKHLLSKANARLEHEGA